MYRYLHIDKYVLYTCKDIYVLTHKHTHLYIHNTHRDLCTNTKIWGHKYGFLHTHKYTQVYSKIHK